MRKTMISIMLILVSIALTYTPVTAGKKYTKKFNTIYETSGKNTYDRKKATLGSCRTCHTMGPWTNSYGEAFKNNEYNFAAIEPLDSDGDGFDNITEIKAGTFPSDPKSKPNTKK